MPEILATQEAELEGLQELVIQDYPRQHAKSLALREK